ncbi:MAG: hypothetical protein ACXWV5_08655 [Flavitalea sp.]
METRDSRKIVPSQQKGSETNAEYSYSAGTADEAMVIFQNACERLLNVNSWDKYSGKVSAIFRVTDETGSETSGPIKKGYYFKIDIPGPGSLTGDGYDWVQIEKIDTSSNNRDDWESIAIRVRPSSNPKNENQDVAHFFNEEATSNFVVRREGLTITAGVYGRNEIPNTQVHNVVDKTRNAAIGLTAVSGVSSFQWNNLVKGIVGK